MSGRSGQVLRVVVLTMAASSPTALLFGSSSPAESKGHNIVLPLAGPCWAPGPAMPPKPLSYRDPRTNILFYVESDGRHLAAFGPAGRLLWVRNPFEDGKLCHYRNKRPVIASIETVERGVMELSRQANSHINPRDRYLRIVFDSSQFGWVNERTGDFTFMGQN